MRMVAWFHWLPSNKRKSKERKVSSVSDHTCLDIRTNATPILRSYLLLTLTIKLPIENNLVHNRHGLQSHSKISQRIKGMRPQLYPRHCHLWPSSPFSWSCPRHEDQFEQCRGFFLKKWKKQQNLSFTHLHHHTVFRIQNKASTHHYGSLLGLG